METKTTSLRRTEAYAGTVNFPINDTSVENTGEGGMFVKLLVIPLDSGQKMDVCCGAINTYECLSEVLINDDLGSFTDELHTTNDVVEDLLALRGLQKSAQSKYFPDRESDTDYSGLSVSCLASILLGSTGWSGWDSEAGEYWYCTYEDLTEKGKTLYNLLKGVYVGHEIRILTYLDT